MGRYRDHKLERVTSVYGIHQATCKCGWVGPSRGSKYSANGDYALHLQSLKNQAPVEVPAPPVEEAPHPEPEKKPSNIIQFPGRRFRGVSQEREDALMLEGSNMTIEQAADCMRRVKI